MAALVLGGVGFTVIGLLRMFLHHRRTGDTGLRPGALLARSSGAEFVAAWLLGVGLLSLLVNPLLVPRGLDRLWHVPILPWVGLVAAVLGLGLAFVAQSAMGVSWRIGVDARERTRLVTDGVFGVVRNPIYSAILLGVAGLALMVPTVVALAAVGAILVAVQVEVRLVEEPYLVGVHGESYRRYRARVGRFLPGVGRR